MPRGGLSTSTRNRQGSQAPTFACEVMASLVALTAVALAQPILDLLGRNAAFLVAHDAGRVDVVLLAIGLTLLLPLGLAGVVLLVARVHRPAGRAAHLLLIAVLVAILALVVFRRAGVLAGLPGAVVLLVAAGLAALVAWLYARTPTLRRAVAWAALAAPAVVLLFLLATPASALLFPETATFRAEGLDQDSPPLVVAIFDELPVASLLRPDGEVDAASFPAFGRLAGHSTLYRNFTAVHGQTSDAIPATLTGRYPRSDALPIAADHPDNLIALLSEQYELHVLEPLTQLCPPGRCRDAGAPAPQRYRRLVQDLSVVASHLILPQDLTAGLPPIDEGWTDFRAAAAVAGKENAVRNRFREAREIDQSMLFADFTRRVDQGPDPTFHFVHTMLPHSPWRYLPDGRAYVDSRERPGMVKGVWQEDEWRVWHNYQRHLVQTQMVDRLLGSLIDRLQEVGLYDDAVVAVLADHGISFTPGTSLRVIKPGTFGEIAAVPFFLKLPGQREGRISDRPLEAVDVLPTILDALGATSADGLDGRSALDDGPERTEKRFHGASEVLTFPADGEEEWPAVRRRWDVFGRRRPFAFPYNIAPDGLHHLLGAAPPVSPAAPPGVRAIIDDVDRYDDVDLDVDASPVLLTGLVESSRGSVPDILAISINDRVAAVVRVDPGGPTRRAFRALLPPETLLDGQNDVDILAVGTDGQLTPLAEGG